MNHHLGQIEQDINQLLTKSQQIFKQGNLSGANFLQQIQLMIQQFDYLKNQVNTKPQYMAEFTKNFNEFNGFLTSSKQINTNQIQQQLGNVVSQENEQLQSIFNKMKFVFKSVNGQAKKQILVFSENSSIINQLHQIAQNALQQIAGSSKGSQFDYYSFENEEQFKDHLVKNCESVPLVILSDVSSLLNNFLLELISELQDRNHFKVEGMFLICKKKRLSVMKEALKNIRYLPSEVSLNFEDCEVYLNEILNKKEFRRVVTIQSFSQYVAIPATYFQDKSKEFGKKPLSSFKNSDFAGCLKKVSQYIQEKKISIFQECWDQSACKQIVDLLKNDVFNTNNEDLLQSAFYKLMNSSLNVLNQPLLLLLEPILVPFYIALSRVKYQQESLFFTSNTPEFLLYRGTSIPSSNLDLIQKNQKIILPAFSSFTSNKQTAEYFLKNQKTDTDTVPVLFMLSCNKKQANQESTPKHLKLMSVFSGEDEYLVPLFSLFNVESSNQRPDGSYLVSLKQ